LRGGPGRKDEQPGKQSDAGLEMIDVSRRHHELHDALGIKSCQSKAKLWRVTKRGRACFDTTAGTGINGASHIQLSGFVEDI
jgi:hypothetical protein